MYSLYADEDEEIDDDKGRVLVDATRWDGFAVDLNGQHGVGVDDAFQL